MFILFIPQNCPFPSTPTTLMTLRNSIAKKAGIKGMTEYFIFIPNLRSRKMKNRVINPRMRSYTIV